MTTSQKNDGMRYTPTTAAANELIGLVQAYDEAYAKAHAVATALAAWALAFFSVKVGDILEVGERYGKAGYISNFTVRDSFSGWKGNRRRMLIQRIDAVTHAPLAHHPRLQIQISGVPLKDDNQPFKGANCSVTLDVLEQAMAFDFNSESGYRSYLKDALGRYVDNVVGPDESKAA